MIPINETAIVNYDISNDKNYSLLLKEYKYCNKNIKEIREKSVKIYNIIKQDNNINLEKRCCNFKLLEEKCKEYKK